LAVHRNQLLLIVKEVKLKSILLSSLCIHAKRRKGGRDQLRVALGCADSLGFLVAGNFNRGLVVHHHNSLDLSLIIVY